MGRVCSKGKRDAGQRNPGGRGRFREGGAGESADT